MSDQWRRLAPLTGVVFAVCLVAGFTIGGSTPDAHDSGAKVLAYFQAHHAKEFVSDFVIFLGVAFFLFFTASLRSFLRQHEDAEGLATLGFVGSVLLGGGGAILASLNFALADGRNVLDPSGAVAINLLANDLFWPFTIGVGVFGIGFGLAIVRSGALPRWLGWVAFGLGIVGLTPFGFLAFIVFLLWSAAVGVLVFQRGGSAAGPAAQPA